MSRCASASLIPPASGVEVSKAPMAGLSAEWLIPAGAPTGATAALAVALVLLFATTYSFVGVPYQALVPVITEDYDERTRLIGLKAIFSAAGAVLGGAVALVVSDRVEVETALRIMALLFGALVAVTILVAARALGELALLGGLPPVIGELLAGVLLGLVIFGVGLYLANPAENYHKHKRH